MNTLQDETKHASRGKPIRDGAITRKKQIRKTNEARKKREIIPIERKTISV